MDCDLQDQPEEIPKLFSKAREGYDVVFGRRYQRQDSFLKRLGSALFYRTLTYFADKHFDPAVANFSVISRKVVLSLRDIREQNRNYTLSVGWLGFRTCYIDIEHAAREIGKSSYSLRRLIYFAYDIIVAHSNKPLRLSVAAGFLMSTASLGFAVYLVFNYYYHGIPVEGWTSTMVSIFFVGGVLMGNMGILGIYIGKVFNETKGRPIYVISDRKNL
jgi:dolichol-phosphate mannosyltransferase